MIKYITEFIGTFIFLSVILNSLSKNSGFVSFAPLAIGLALTAAIEFGGNISGGHYNPAVSLLMVLNKALPPSELVPYIAVQILGAIAAKYFFDKVKPIRGG